MLPNTHTPNLSRRGRWTESEQKYARTLIAAFKSGHLNLIPGTSLRNYLSSKLKCDPMRISKKFTKETSIGRRYFKPAPETEENIRMRKIAEDEIIYFESKLCGTTSALFYDNISTQEISSDESESTNLQTTAPSVLVQSKSLNRSPLKCKSITPAKKLVVDEDDNEASALLMNFYDIATKRSSCSSLSSCSSELSFTSFAGRKNDSNCSLESCTRTDNETSGQDDDSQVSSNTKYLHKPVIDKSTDIISSSLSSSPMMPSMPQPKDTSIVSGPLPSQDQLTKTLLHQQTFPAYDYSHNPIVQTPYGPMMIWCDITSITNKVTMPISYSLSPYPTQQIYYPQQSQIMTIQTPRAKPAILQLFREHNLPEPSYKKQKI